MTAPEGPYAAGADAGEVPPVRDLKWRRRLVVALVVLTTISTFVSAIAVWSHNVLLKTDKWVATVGPLAENEEVTDALAVYLVDELVAAINLEQVAAEALPDRASGLAVPLSAAIQSFLTTEVEKLLASEQFQKVWVDANRITHEQVVRLLRGEPGVVYADDGQVNLNLIPALVRILDKVERFGILPDSWDSPDITRTTPPDEAVSELSTALDRDLKQDFGQIKVFDSEQLAQAQDAVKVFDDLVLGLVILTIVLAIMSLVLSVNRRRTLLGLGVGLVVALVVTAAVLQSTSNYVLSQITDDTNRGAAAAVLREVLQSLRALERWVLIVGIILIVAAWLAGESRSAKGVRSVVRRDGSAPETDAAVGRSVGFLARHRDGLMILGVVVALVGLIVSNVTFGTLIVIGGLLAAYLVAIWLVTKAHGPEALDDVGDAGDAAPEPTG